MSGRANSDNYISIQDVSMIYNVDDQDTRVSALSSVSLTIEKHSIVTFIGPSGCGKSTLLNCIGDLIVPTSGVIHVDGISANEARVQRFFGLVPQDATLLDWKTVFENIVLPLRVIGRQIDRQGIEELIDLVGLSGFESFYPAALSGGMKQRVSIARALSYSPPILLMDEPFAALDALLREKMNVEVLRIWQETGNTIIFVTHNITEAVFISDQVVVMSARPGKVKEVVSIDIPRPRTSKDLSSPKAHAFIDMLREILTEEYAEKPEQSFNGQAT
jgi:NitT/TauT family transport system ATP-binding protein